MSELLNALQAASNTAAGTVSGPVDLLAWALRKAGVPVPQDAAGSSEWMRRQGLMADVRPGVSQMAGDTLGLLSPIAAAAYGPQIARGLLKGGENLAQPRTLNQQRGAIILGDEWVGKNPPKIEKLAKNKDKFLYHSGVADDAENLRYGIEPSNDGPWIREVASGAVDDVDDLLASSTPLAWLSDQPSWVAIKVARKLDKPLSAVTADDIAKHGHVAIINKKSPSVSNTYYIPDAGLSNGEYSLVRNMRGEDVKAYTTPLYGETSSGARMEPFGVERNEYVSTDTVEPMLQLTGNDLLEFLKRSGLLGP